jgi:YfiH family protein
MNTLRFDSLQAVPGLHHAITTRAGGDSNGEYSGLNLAFHVEDDAQSVRSNRRCLGEALGYDASTLVAAQQVHGVNAHIVGAHDSGRGSSDGDSAIPETDALIVAEPRIPVMILVADCAPILIVDSVHRVLAVVHAGWRGALARIASQTLQVMARAFDTRAEELRVGIGPCLCLECLEVGEEVAAQVMSTHVLRHSQWEKPHLDLRAMIAEDLIENGVLALQIEVMERCPCCENETFFSHRAQNGQAGRFGLVAWWDGI